MVITFPDDTEEVIDAIRSAIGRDITINVTVSGIPCPVSGCELDPITNLSTNQFCQTCNGFHWINTTSGFTVKAHVTWKPSEFDEWVSGGKVVDGDCLVQIKYTVANLNAVDNAKNYIVDGKTLVKSDIIYRGVPELNRILVALEQEED